MSPRDITEHKQAEVALKDALQYAENIVETVREPLLVLDARLRIRTANRSFYRAFRVTREETEGRLVYDLGNGQWDIPALRRLLEVVLPENTAFDDFEVLHEFPAIGRRVMLVNARRIEQPGNDTALILLALEDVTERRRLEDERRELETRFTSLVKNIRDYSIFSLDPQGCITSWNLEAERILGYSEAEALGQHFSIIFTPEDLEAGIPARELAIALSEGRAEDEHWHARKGGERFWALGIVTPTRDARGAHTGYSKILRDMTDRKRAEVALRERAAQQAAVAALGQKALLERDMQSLMNEVVHSVAAVLGVEYCTILERLRGGRELLLRAGLGWREGLVGHATVGAGRESQAGYALLSGEPVVVDDLRTEPRFVAPSLLIEHGVVSGLSCRITGPAGQPFGVLGAHTSKPRQFTPEDIYFLEAVANLVGSVIQRHHVEKELQQSEAKHRAVVDMAADAIITIDKQGIVQTVNPAVEELFGYVAGEMIGRNVNLLMPSPYREEHDDYLARYLATGEKRMIGIGREVVGLRKDGTTFPMCLAVAEAHLGEHRLFIGFIRDISERKQAEEDLRRNHEGLKQLVTELQAKHEEVRATTQQLWQAAKLASVGELAASIAHELNNPLATLSLRVESLLDDAPQADPNRRMLEIIQNETRRMSALVANLLQFSRRGYEQISTVDIRQELTGAINLIQHQLLNRRIVTVQELATDTPLIYADRQKLRQVFLNLFTNASDAMPQGGMLTLRSLAETLDGGQAAVRIEVADSGTGIPPDHIAKVFDPYFTTKEEGQGTGLGLAICRRIVEDHHGTIQIESAVGRGSVVTIVLPVRGATKDDRMRIGPLIAEGQDHVNE